MIKRVCNHPWDVIVVFVAYLKCRAAVFPDRPIRGAFGRIKTPQTCTALFSLNIRPYMRRLQGFNVCFHLHSCFQGNQEATNPADAMAQTYTPQYAHPAQNGIPAEFSATHALPTQDYAGQNRVPDHGLTLYTPAQTHSDLANADSSTPAISTGTNTATVR